MRWFKHIAVALITLFFVAGLAVSATDTRHPPAQPPVETAPPARAVPDFSPQLERLSSEVEEERAAIGSTAAAMENSNAKVGFLLIGCGILLVLLFCVLIAQVVILYRSVEVVRAETITRNRPRLTVRQLDLEIFEPGKLAKVLWMVENIGNSTASVVEARATLTVVRRGRLPSIPEYDSRNHTTGGLDVEPGRVVPFVQFTREDVAAADYDAIFRAGSGGIFFYGYLLYVDAAAARRRVGFCRQYDPQSGRFIVFDDINYEFAD